MKSISVILSIMLLISCSSRYYYRPAYVLPIYESTQSIELGDSPFEISKSDYDKMNLHGNVKSVHETRFGVSKINGKITKDVDLGDYSKIVGEYNKLLLFNEAGRIVKETLYPYQDSIQSFHSIETRTYGSQGNIIEKHLTYNTNNKRITKYTYHKGRIATITLNDFICSRTDSTLCDFHDKHITNYYYDSLSNTFTETTPYSKVIHQYDRKSNRISSRNYSSPQSDSLWCENKYMYDDLGNLLEEKFINENIGVEKRIVYKYDEKGNPTVLTGYKANDVFAGKESNSYTYDAEGNWVSKVVLINNMPIAIIERVIEYY